MAVVVEVVKLKLTLDENPAFYVLMRSEYIGAG